MRSRQSILLKRGRRLLREARGLLPGERCLLPMSPRGMRQLVTLIFPNQVVTRVLEDGIVIQRMTPGDTQTATLLRDGRGWSGHLSSSVQTGWQRVNTSNELAELLSDVTGSFVSTATVEANLRISYSG